ncbi:hypothetical protein C0J52_13699 [Blattella germanica]|nr:hypothetical protein C0J52_13699 [Blattella germanica]
MFASTFLQWMLIAATVILVCIYWYFKSSYGFWKQKGIKFVEPSFPYGNVKDVFHVKKSISECYKEYYDSYPEDRYIGLFELSQPILLVRDPALLKHVFVKDFQHFQKRASHIFEEMDPLTLNLLYLSGSKWQSVRSKLTPTFSSGKMKMMFQLMLEVAEQLAETMKNAAKSGEMLEFKDIMLSYSMEIIGSCIFGLQFNAIKDPNSDFRKMEEKRRTEQQEYFFVKKMVRLHCPSLARFLNLKFMSDDVTNFFLSSVKNTMEYRVKNNVVRNDFIQLLMELKSKGEFDFDEKDDNCYSPDGNKFYTSQNSNGTFSYTKADCYMAAQAFSFLVAGFDTSSSTLSFCLYELAINPEIQDKLRGTIKSTLQQYDGKITYDAVQEMSYLNKVLDGNNNFINKFFSPKVVLHRVLCMRFGLLQVKLGIITLLLNYEFNVCEKTSIPLKLDPKEVLLSADVWLKICKIKSE